jgi:hypothetical protein
MDNSPTALFDSYEQDFQQIVGSIRQKLEGGDDHERGGECSTALEDYACIAQSIHARPADWLTFQNNGKQHLEG